ncbi:MAG: 16S rRNA (guanine(966)-N(2))-methyltransferase RsmD [Verrucomicrobiota bacterium]|nr:16S rRNA (guanine(966)-N(2))-methyltransferase RsmD [Verrucomicrobiota bacterium]
MRVIGGSAGGLQLTVPAHGVRPTMDRVKAAIFSSLGDAIVEASVLDLFAGAGGLGIEALSRGAKAAVFVDSDRTAARAIEKNLGLARLEGRVRQQDAFDFLEQRPQTDTFDIIFADPPYERTAQGATFTELLLQSDRLLCALANDGTFVLEKPPTETMPPHLPWRVIRARAYGATEVLFLAKA